MGVELMDVVIGILPMLLLIGAWFLFMRKFPDPAGLQRRQVEALERIATVLEKRG